MRNLFVFVALSLLSIPLFSQKLAVYFPYYRSTQQVDAIQYDKVTDVIYAFAKPTASGGSEILGPNIFEALRLKCAQNSVPFHLAMGGYGLSDNFRVIAADENLRNTFAQHCAALCTQYGLAGIDIDWEFPSPSEVDNVNLLLEALQTALGAISTPQNRIALSVTVGGEQGHANYFKSGFSDYVDYVSIMAYDAPVGTWGHHSSMAFMQNSISVWEGMGVPNSKMLVGVPFYGRCAGESSYADISASNPATAFVSDTYNGYCYNGQPTLIAKTDTAMSKGCAGIMVWEVSHDRSDQYSLLSVLDEALEEYQCPIPNLEMEEVYTDCFNANISLNSNVAEASGRIFSWFANGNLLYSGSENHYSTNTIGQFELVVQEGECEKSISFEVNRTMDLSSLPPSIILCSPGIDTIFSPYKFDDGYTTIWDYNGDNMGSNMDFVEVLQSGVYSLEVSSPFCPSVSKNIQVSNAGPMVNSQSICSGSVVELFAANESMDFKWYYEQNDATSFFEGDTLTYVVNATDTLYYEGVSSMETHVFTEIESGFNQNASFYGTKFTLSDDAKLKSFELATIASGRIEVSVLDDDLNLVYSGSTDANAGNNNLTVNWDLASGTYYLICTEAPAGQLKLFSTYNSSDEVKGTVTLHSGVYNSFAAPAYSAKSEYFGFFREIEFEAGSPVACGRKAVILYAEECSNCVEGEFGLNNILLTYGDPATIVKPNYIGDNDLYFYTNNSSVSFASNYIRPQGVGNGTYYVAEICDGDTIQIVSAQFLVQKANLTIKAVNDTIYQNETPPSNIDVKYYGFKNGETEDVLLQTPLYEQSTDGTIIGEFQYDRTQDGKAENYNLAYSTGALVVLMPVGIIDKYPNDNVILHTPEGSVLKIRKANHYTAFSVDGKLLWTKYFDIGEYNISKEVFVLVDKNNSTLR